MRLLGTHLWEFSAAGTLLLTLLAWFTSVVDRWKVNAEFVDVAGIGLAGRR